MTPETSQNVELGYRRPLWKRIRLKMAGIWLVLICGLIVYISQQDAPTHWAYDEEIAATAATQKSILEGRFGIVIGTGDPASFSVPPDPEIYEERPILELKPVEKMVIPTAIKGIHQALKVYPEEVFKEHCSAIFLAGNLTLEGYKAGGTYGKNWIALAIEKRSGPERAYNFTVHALHHEFSSIIWQKQPQTKVLWEKTLPHDWIPQLTTKDTFDPKNIILREASTGFLNAYAATNSENDFNTYAEFVFVEPDKLIRLAQEHKIIAAKLSLFISAYENTDTRFGAYFKETGLKDVAKIDGFSLDEFEIVSQRWTTDVAAIAETEATKKQIQKKYNIVIETENIPNFALDSGKKASQNKIKLNYRNVMAESLLPSVRSLKSALEIYPVETIKSNVSKVYIVTDLTYDNLSFWEDGGQDWMILANQKTYFDRKENEYDLFVDHSYKGLHHYLASKIWQEQRQTQIAWKQLLPAGWSEERNENKLFDNHPNEASDPSTGFLSTFGTKSAENDFKIYAEYVFTNDYELISLAKNNDLVAKKLAVFIQAYERENPEFSNYFKTMGLKGINNP